VILDVVFGRFQSAELVRKLIMYQLHSLDASCWSIFRRWS